MAQPVRSIAQGYGVTDARLFPSNGEVALSSLRGQVKGVRFTDGTLARISSPVVDLLRRPFGPRDRQLLLGAPVTVIDRFEGWAFVQAECGYVGYVPARALRDGPVPSHAVRVRMTHAYTKPDLKSPERIALPFGARLPVTGDDPDWAQTPVGFVPRQHLRDVDAFASDPVEIARMFLGTPYLWGGNSPLGIDCSGLVQTICRACGVPCPGDADMQQQALGQALPETAPLQPADAVFWRGHVGIMETPETLIHANAHTMAVSREPFAEACARIASSINSDSTGGGPVIARRRFSQPRG